MMPLVGGLSLPETIERDSNNPSMNSTLTPGQGATQSLQN